MTDFNIRYGLSSDLFIDGQINPKLIIEAGCWYLCTDTAELFLGIDTGAGLTLKLINEPDIDIPVDDLALKSELNAVKQEVIQTVKPEVEEVKTKVEEEILPKVETVDTLKDWVENKEYLQDIDLEGYATESYVDNAISNIEIPEPEKTDLSNYYIKEEVDAAIASVTSTFDEYAKVDDIPDVSKFITTIPDEYAKKTDLFSKSYNDLTDTPVIPSVDGLATEEYVDAAVAAAKPPVVDLSKYALKSDVALKADEILFTTNRYVANAIGSFEAGESVRGLTVAELFAKLLGLSDKPQGVVDDILVNEHGLYQFNDSIEVEKINFTKTVFNTAEEYESAPEGTTFYQYTYTNDEGQKVTESGYQHYSVAQDFIYYMIMLPSTLIIGENVKVQAWSPSRNMWMDTTTVLEGDPEVIVANFAEVGLEMPAIPEGYTMWVDFSDVNPGNKVRYIIIE